jgi:hypothetical protein
VLGRHVQHEIGEKEAGEGGDRGAEGVDIALQARARVVKRLRQRETCLECALLYCGRRWTGAPRKAFDSGRTAIFAFLSTSSDLLTAASHSFSTVDARSISARFSSSVAASSEGALALSGEQSNLCVFQSPFWHLAL